MYYKPDHFNIKELVDKQTYKYLGDKSWTLFNPYALLSLEVIRTFFDVPVYVNNWYKDGDLQFRGFRPFDCIVGSKYSKHRFGNAFDLNVKGIPAEEVRQVILANKNSIFLHITTLESGVNWVHFDCRMIPLDNRILLVSK